MQRAPTIDRTWPDSLRTDIELVLASRWRVESAQAQRLAADAVALVWAREPMPDGLAAYSLFAAEDERTLLHYAQWHDEAAFEAFRATQRDRRVADVDAIAPAIERLGLQLYRPHRGLGAPEPQHAPGCLVIVEVELDPPGSGPEWIELVLRALADDGGLPSGGLSARFHVSEDGTRVLNYAEWTDAAAHRRALTVGDGSIGRSPSWSRVHAYPGARGTVDRHELLHHIHAHPPT